MGKPRPKTFFASSIPNQRFPFRTDTTDEGNGFPARKIIHPLLNVFLAKEEAFQFAEERRLFYVAITRAKHRAYLACDMAKASDFIHELIQGDEYPIELAEFDSLNKLQDVVVEQCPTCTDGTLVKRESSDGHTFHGCSNYPICKHIAIDCTECGHAVVPNTKERKHECSCNSCNAEWPMCPACDGRMLLKEGKYGQFWGCSNYRQDGDFSCGQTKQVSIHENS
ncbi:topoisomerase DNA-binding C4 zinc finger domain-containing protein [Enterovibrio sp. Hal110]